MHILLSGVVGSVAYGMAGPGSDVDRLGVFAHDTASMFGLDEPSRSIVTTAPDVTYHEAAHAARLLLQANPTLTDLLWLEAYEIRKPLGDELVGLRHAVLCARRVREAYLGYALDQTRKLLARDGTFNPDVRRRTAKHARHIHRLVDHGLELYTTGHLTIRLADPQRCIDFGDQVAADPQRVIPFMAEARHRYEDARTVLPDRPSRGVVEGWLKRVRAEHYRAPLPADA
jgi:hypothetical protein